MLKYLHIENIAVIEKSDIDLIGGFNCLTGETGAGKSIVIDSINAVMGERTSKELIRSGCEFAEVSAVFGDVNTTALKQLEENGVTPDEDGNIIISRKLSLNGKGIIKINGQPITAAILKEISKNLINIHGQHDNQALLNPDNHCGFIDAVAEDEKYISDYYAEFKKLNEIRRELQSLEMNEDEKLRKIDLLKYQINELKSANIKIGEINELNSRLTLVKNYEKNSSKLNEAYFALKGDDDSEGACSLAQKARKALSFLEDKGLQKSAEELGNAIEILETVCADIRDFSDNMALGSLNANEINERLDLLHKLMLKYGENEEKMLSFLEEAEKQLENIEFSDKRIDELGILLDQSTQRLIKFADKLTQERIKAASKFEKQVCEILKYLNMPDVKFAVKIDKGRYTKNGCDTVEFLISANAGEDMKSLHKIASGGELSRVMLAIKSVLSDKDTVDTLIFDEIDSGISGYAAGKVANQLREVAQNRQVICVTHLAQIAAVCDNHLLIEKKTKNNRTFTEVKSLDYNDRIEEIARIMSGTQMTENLYNSAKELLERKVDYENL
ncbi:MAG: DNA repair protein RecN [Clostridia bacterium]|nr:DNA repair protein RecN [Clostridia bacterium]MEE1184708.1 DNA repair protein RecN [Acutalibacteraceae bacterium]